MTIADEIKGMIQTLQDQLVNFEKVPEERLEDFIEFCANESEQYTDERIDTRELQIMHMCMEADVRSAANIGHCGSYTDLVWVDGRWETGEEGDEGDDEEEEDEESEEDEKEE